MPTGKDFHDNRFDSIQALRGIAAVLVVLEHVRFLSCGAFGVDIFFCISGFMMMFTTHKDTSCFFRKRLIRILPFYYLMTLGTFGLLLLFPSMFEQSSADPLQLIQSLLFLPFDIGGGVLQPIYRIGWTVNCEMFFYLLFWISYHISRKWRGALCSALLLGVVLAAQLSRSSFPPLRFYGDPVMLEFALGILSYEIARFLYDKSSPVASMRQRNGAAALCLCVSAILITLLIATKPAINILGFRRPLLWGLPAFCILLAAFLFGLCHKTPAPLVRLGDISFSIYLIHYYPVMFLDRRVFDFSTARPASLAGLPVCLLIVTVLALIAWDFIEKHLTSWLKKMLLPR